MRRECDLREQKATEFGLQQNSFFFRLCVFAPVARTGSLVTRSLFFLLPPSLSFRVVPLVIPLPQWSPTNSAPFLVTGCARPSVPLLRRSSAAAVPHSRPAASHAPNNVRRLAAKASFEQTDTAATAAVGSDQAAGLALLDRIDGSWLEFGRC